MVHFPPLVFSGDFSVIVLKTIRVYYLSKGIKEDMNEDFEPNIVAFLCNWCAYAGADLAGTSRLGYPPNVKVIRVMCSGKLNPMLVVNALQQGADGVLIGGCHPVIATMHKEITLLGEE